MPTPQHKSIQARSVLARASLRRKAPGAAMVEAAIILPLIVVFLGVMEYAHAEYAAKIQVYNDTRYAVWTNAVHACTTAAGSESGDLGDDNQKVNGGSPTADPKYQPSNTVTRIVIKKYKQTGTTTAKVTRGRATYTNSNITATSSVYCNEPSNHTNIFGQVWTFAKSFI